jgi:5'-nucleotidase/UDP-sugar diphosphatase
MEGPIKIEHNLTLLCVNDVYEIEEFGGGVGGLAQLRSLVDRERDKARRRGRHCLFIVCGDFLSASALGEAYKGAHMVNLFNQLGVDYVVFGNHEFDFGNAILRKRIQESKFTWLGTNVLELDGSPFGGSKATHLIQYDNGAFKVGLFGLCTLATPTLSYPDEDVEFAPLLPSATNALHKLKREEGADLVIGVTHVTLAQDKELAGKIGPAGLDIIVGGHDHVPYTLFENKVFINKCGQNAEWLGRIDITLVKDVSKPDRELFISWKQILVRGFKRDAEVQATIERYLAEHVESLQEVIGTVGTCLDSTQTRTHESLMGNFLTDALRELYDGEVCIINGGFIRGNLIYESGYVLRLADIQREFHFPRHAYLIKIKGEYIWQTLEAGVRSVEEKTGYYPQISKGSSYTYDRRQPPGERIVSVKINGEDLDRGREYKLVITEYMFGGGDGFTALTNGTRIPTPYDSFVISEIISDYVRNKKVISPVLEGRSKCIS